MKFWSQIKARISGLLSQCVCVCVCVWGGGGGVCVQIRNIFDAVNSYAIILVLGKL